MDLQNNPTDQFRNVYFCPGIDNYMQEVSANEDRPIDLLFYGQYIKEYFLNRNQLMDFKSNSDYNIKMHLLCQVIREPIINISYIRGKFKKVVFPPANIWKNKDEALFGKELYKAISRIKIVINAGVDFSGKYEVNMRNFEATDCGLCCSLIK